ncbi:hypothetical protein ACHAXT_001867 [Thalassiosira profunda]
MGPRRSRSAAPSSLAAAAATVVVALSSASADALAFDVSSRRSSFAAAAPSNGSCAHQPTAGARHRSSAANLQMKVRSGSSKRSRSSKSSHLIELNNERLHTAGRPGTKKFMDPNKVFIGNLPYDAAEEDVYQLFSEHWNVPLDAVGDRIESVKVIRDWKTGKSKGYGFVQFYEPMVATSAMESINRGGGWKIGGRRVRLDQGKRKEGEEDARKAKKKEKPTVAELDEEGSVIYAALEDVAEGAEAAIDALEEGEEEEDDELGMSEDDMITFVEKGGLRGVMPLTEETAGFLGIEGLYDDDGEGFDEVDEAYYEEYYGANGYDDADFGDVEDDEGDDGEELVYDGVFEEVYNPKDYEGVGDEEEKAMNREQRRAAEKRRKKRKLPFKGFGAPN